MQTDYKKIAAEADSASVTFPVPFLATPKVFLSVCPPAASSPAIEAFPVNVSKTGFTIQLDAEVPTGSKSYKVFWQAHL
jgi:hypothetical protein